MENYVSINSDRLWARLNEVGHIGSDPRGGISRFAWEPPYKEAVMLLIRWIKEAGLTARIDTVGNVFAHWKRWLPSKNPDFRTKSLWKWWPLSMKKPANFWAEHSEARRYAGCFRTTTLFICAIDRQVSFSAMP